MLTRSASPFDSISRRLAVYGYLTPLVQGRRVIEIGAGSGAGAARLRALGAAAVLGVDGDGAAVNRARAEVRTPGVDFRVLDRRLFDGGADRGFDVVVVPEAAALFRPGTSLTPAALRGLCGARGHLVLLAESGDRAGANGGPGYYDLNEACTRLFPRVRMFGLTPFAAFGLAEFAEAASGLRIDGGLVEDGGEQPTHYLAIAGPDEDEEIDLGYALVQIPADSAREPDVAPADAPGDWRQRVAEAEGRAEGLMRVSRAQTEEIEELRARLRRGVEARAELDQEMARLRKALAEADASVLDLTRRTTQEMAALAQRITSGLRPEAERGEGDAPTGRLREELRRREEELASAESALSERDERIAQLEAERQELSWRLSAASETRAEAEPRRDERSDEASAQRQRELALEQYRQAAAAHLDEVGRLREALAEQSTLVAELEDALSVSGRRLSAALEETERARRHAAEVEEADRARRSRLAEVEGTLLRLQRQTALAPKPEARVENGVAPGGVTTAEWERRIAAANREWQDKLTTLEGKLAVLEARLTSAVEERDAALTRARDAAEKLSAAERAAAERAAAPPGGDDLEGARREVAQLRAELERSEEQLWETKGQLLLDRERMAVLEHQIAAAPSEPIMTEAAHQAIMNAVYKELAELEAGVRAEIGRLEALESTVEAWRADLAKGGEPSAVARAPLPRIE